MIKIGIIGAMDEEVDILKEIMEIQETVQKSGLKFYIGKLEDKDVVLVRCGIGKVNAALCTQILLSEFNVNSVVNTGVAGALHNELGVYDIVISTDAMYHDFDTTVFGNKIGEIPRMDTSIFKADGKLIDAAYESTKEEVRSHKVVKGRVVTGDIFISSKELKDKLVNELGAYCGEMEGAAIAHVCHVNEVPFVVIRAMSDKADGSADVTYEEFVQEAAHNSKDIVLNMLRHI
jgi:adenosylhomocysteine nucleosidase